MNTGSSETNFAAVWPRGRRAVAHQALAERLPTLEGKKIAQLWDYLFRGDEIFPLLEQGLAQRFPGVQFVKYETFGSTHGDREHDVLDRMPETLRRLGVDAVISGMAC